MVNSSCPDINTMPSALAKAENESQSQVIPAKQPVAFGSVMAIPLHKSLVKHFQITEDTVFQQEIVEGGILLRIVTKDASS
jgi:hypothetical protein